MSKEKFEEFNSEVKDFGVTDDRDEWLSSLSPSKRLSAITFLDAIPNPPTGYMLESSCRHNGIDINSKMKSISTQFDNLPVGLWYIKDLSLERSLVSPFRVTYMKYALTYGEIEP